MTPPFTERDIIRHLQSREPSRVVEYPRDDESLVYHELLLQSPKRAARALLAEWQQKDPTLITPTRVEILQRDKSRPIYRFPFSTLVYHSLWSERLLPEVERVLPESVYSYRPKRSNLGAARALQHRKAAQQKTFYFKGDIRKYSDYVNPRHPRLLQFLKARLNWSPELIEKLLKLVAMPDQVGLYVGSPIANYFQNFYLMPLDEAAARFRFYGRFNDDFLVLLNSAAELTAFRQELDLLLKDLGLTLNEKKSQWGEWNSSGFRSHADYTAKQSIDWLGFEHRFSQRALICNREHLQFFRRDFQFRLRTGRRSQTLGSVSDWVQFANGALDPLSPLRCESADNILNRTECRATLRALDMWVSAELGKVLKCRPSSLYRSGLFSFVAARNQREPHESR